MRTFRTVIVIKMFFSYAECFNYPLSPSLANGGVTVPEPETSRGYCLGGCGRLSFVAHLSSDRDVRPHLRQSSRRDCSGGPRPRVSLAARSPVHPVCGVSRRVYSGLRGDTSLSLGS